VPTQAIVAVVGRAVLAAASSDDDDGVVSDAARGVEKDDGGSQGSLGCMVRHMAAAVHV